MMSNLNLDADPSKKRFSGNSLEDNEEVLDSFYEQYGTGERVFEEDLGRHLDSGGSLEGAGRSVSRTIYTVVVEEVTLDGEKYYAVVFDDGRDEIHTATEFFSSSTSALALANLEVREWWKRW